MNDAIAILMRRHTITAEQAGWLLVENMPDENDLWVSPSRSALVADQFPIQGKVHVPEGFAFRR